MSIARCQHPERVRSCGCPDNPESTVVDESRHTAWHAQIAPLAVADAATLELAYGWPAVRTRTFVDDQFDAARGISPAAPILRAG